VANLPYVPDGDRDRLAREVGHDPPEALFGGPDGLDILRRFLGGITPHLAPDGVLAVEFGIGPTVRTAGANSSESSK
jgi:release factor glutamine methyltransferase